MSILNPPAWRIFCPNHAGILACMSVLLDGFPCELPDNLAQRCLQTSPPAPTSPWLGYANRYVHPIGLRPGRAWVLILKAYLDRISTFKPLTLTFTADPANTGQDIQFETVTFKNLRTVGTPIDVTPGVRGDAGTTYFVELADRRIDCIGLCGKRYNWRVHPDAPYESESTNSGTAWTWTTLLTDLWDAVGNLGTFPTLPVTPSGTPEQIDGMACRAADLLEDLLLLNGMGVKYNPSDDVFTIVSFAANSSNFFGGASVTARMLALGAELERAESKRIWDQNPASNANPKLPRYCRVVFPVWSPTLTPIDTASYFVVDVADTAPDFQTLPGSTFALVQDWIPCRTSNQGTVLNSSNLVTRAAEVAANFYSVARLANYYPLHRTYTGIGMGTVVRPGEAIDVMVWEDIGAGPKTHVIQTGRLGFGPIFGTVGSLYTSGSLITGHPYGASTSTNLKRNPIASTNAKHAVMRPANAPPGELRTYNQGPFATASGATAATQSAGGGVSSLMDRAGPLRQWDAAVEARSVDGHGQRLWLAKPRVQCSSFVRCTSTTPDGTTAYYPAQEVFFDPDKDAKDWDTGDVCWLWTPNSETPTLNYNYWCLLQGSDGEASPKKVYMTSAVAPGGGTELKGLTFTSDTSSTADTDPGNGKFKWNNATQASATKIYIDYETADGKDVSNFLQSLGPTGDLFLQQSDDASKWQLWRWTTPLEDGTGYYKITVTYVAGSAIDNSKTVYTQWSSGREFKGLVFQADTSSTADSDPGNGYFKWNHATQASATFLYFDNQTFDGQTVNTSLWTTIGSSGYIHLQQCDDSSKWQLWRWSKVPADGTGYYKFAVTLQALNGSIADEKPTYCVFISEGGMKARKNSTGSTYGPRSRFNFIEGSGISLTLADDSTDDELDLTVTCTGGNTFSGARVTHSENQTVTPGNPALFDTEYFDTDGYHSTVSNTSRLTVPTDGIYMIGVNFAGTTPSEQFSVDIMVNGGSGTLVAHWQFLATSTPIAHCCMVTIWEASASDYFEVRTGTAEDYEFYALQESEPVFWIIRLRDDS